MQSHQEQLVHSLQNHCIRTVTELRRIEKIVSFSDLKDAELITAAWNYYVNSNNLLNELRSLTKNYPFSSECLDEAKREVQKDPKSFRSWNYCWLVLTKTREMKLISKHAWNLAATPVMWGGRIPTPGQVLRLAEACIVEWTRALEHMLRHWDIPPTREISRK